MAYCDCYPDDCQHGSINWELAPWNQEDIEVMCPICPDQEMTETTDGRWICPECGEELDDADD